MEKITTTTTKTKPVLRPRAQAPRKKKNNRQPVPQQKRQRQQIVTISRKELNLLLKAHANQSKETRVVPYSEGADQWTAKHIPDSHMKASAVNALAKAPVSVQKQFLGMPECAQNFMLLLGNPFTATKGKNFCNPIAMAANVVPWSQLGRGTLVAGPGGEIVILLNTFNLCNDVPALVVNDPLWNSAGSIDVSNPNLALYYNNDMLPYKASELMSSGAFSSEIPARLVAGGICGQFIGNATEAQGQWFGYTTKNNELVTSVPLSEISSSILAPKAVTELGSCYTRVFTATDPSQVNFLNPEGSIPQTHPTDPVYKGFNLVLYGSGFKPGAPVSFEWATHAEYGPTKTTIPLAKPTEHLPVVAQQINSTMAQIQRDHVQTKPKEGFFDKLLHGFTKVADAIAEPVGKFVKALF